MIRVKKEVIEFNTTTQDFVYDCIEGDLWVVQEIINGDNKKPNDVENRIRTCVPYPPNGTEFE
jgi:hypothetical protein